MARRILIYLLTFPFKLYGRRRARRIARERLERLGNAPEDWNRPMSHQPVQSFSFPQGDDKNAELSANYVPSWAKPEK